MFKSEYITTHNNIESGSGISCWQGHQCSQSHHAFEVFCKFMQTINPSRIIEIGTAAGGFTMFLKWCANELDLNTNVISYDIHKPWTSQSLLDYDIDFRHHSWHTESSPHKATEEIVNLIQSPGQTLLLCDGGNKIFEFNTLAPFLKSGDIIMAHDYAYDQEKFKNSIYNKIWNWHEISNSDISEISTQENLHPVMQEDFDRCVWVCKTKK